jgi:hypothetical protein
MSRPHAHALAQCPSSRTLCNVLLYRHTLYSPLLCSAPAPQTTPPAPKGSDVLTVAPGPPTDQTQGTLHAAEQHSPVPPSSPDCSSSRMLPPSDNENPTASTQSLARATAGPGSVPRTTTPTDTPPSDDTTHNPTGSTIVATPNPTSPDTSAPSTTNSETLPLVAVQPAPAAAAPNKGQYLHTTRLYTNICSCSSSHWQQQRWGIELLSKPPQPTSEAHHRRCFTEEKEG